MSDSVNAHDPSCLFCRIVKGEIPSKKVYEDELVFAFHDIHPVAPLHVLVIPKVHVPSLKDASAADEAALGRMATVAAKIADENGSPDGFRTIVNTGRVGRQEVYHIHMHVLGGPKPLGVMLRNEDKV